MISLKVDPELQSFLPPLDDDTKGLLEASLKDEGCRDPIIVWDKGDVIVDGHNRYEICTRLDIPFQIEKRSFASPQQARLFMLNSQLSRRNLTDLMLKTLRGNYYKMLKQTQTKNLVTTGQIKNDGGALDPEVKVNLTSAKKDRSNPTAKEAAKKFGTSEKTIRRDEKVADAIDKVRETKGDKAAADILAGKTKVRTQDLEKIAGSKTAAKDIEKIMKGEPLTEPKKTKPVAPKGMDDMAHKRLDAFIASARLLVIAESFEGRKKAVQGLVDLVNQIDGKNYDLPLEYQERVKDTELDQEIPVEEIFGTSEIPENGDGLGSWDD